jgi:hypothetical protein
VRVITMALLYSYFYELYLLLVLVVASRKDLAGTLRTLYCYWALCQLLKVVS